MKFRVIVADCPWAFGDKLTMSDVKRGAASNYPVLDIEALKALRVSDVALDDAVLAHWVPDSLLADGLAVMNAWGFRQTQVWTWVKTSKGDQRGALGGDIPDDLALAFGMGRLARAACEHLLVGVRGSPYKHLQNKSTRNVFLHPATKHSQKPESVQDALERMFPEGPWLELFARRVRPGWTCLGNELTGRDIREDLAHLREW